MGDWLTMSAAELGRGIEAGQIDPVELCKTYLDAIGAHPLKSRIYARLTPERAMTEAAAAAARAKSGQRLSPLDGVPASWKDLFDSAGVATEAGTALLAGRIPDADAAVLATATAMGMVCLGKTHMSEIAFSGLGYNPVTETPPCVNDPDAVPGGSSSGAAASVAFGLAPVGIGSDTGGSVRLPSAWNDLVGFKPTHGALPLDGVVPLCASFDTIGPLCRTVEDAALTFEVLGGPPTSLTGATLKGKRLLVVETVGMEDLEDAPAAAFEAAVAKLIAAGAVVERAEIQFLKKAFELTATVYPAEAYAYWKPYVEAAPDKMFYHIRERVSAGGSVMATDFIAAWTKLRALRVKWAEATQGYDAVICPTAPNMPPKVERITSDDAYYVSSNLNALRNTRIGNLMGLCGLSLPTGTPSCGILFNALPGEEERLLQLGAAAEAVLT
ncbi:amidase [Flavimaricola marinus]|nr:amidase family protein [Flavimaricola marinus]